MTFHPADIRAVMAANRPRLLATIEQVQRAIAATTPPVNTNRKAA